MSVRDGWRVRDALDEDRLDLLDMLRALQSFELRLDPNRAPPEAMARPHFDALERWARENDGGVLVAARAGADALEMRRPQGFLVFGVVEEFGCFVARENQRYGVISDLYVREATRRDGAGHALLEEVRARLIDLGVRRLEVTALWANAQARAAYEAMGLAPSHLTYAEKLPRR